MTAHTKYSAHGNAINLACKNCGGSFDVKTFRKFAVCPYCRSRMPFPGFDYRKINWRSSMYSNVKLWMDCPACRSPNMYLGPSGKRWRCSDCGYMISRFRKNTSVFWFCDNCETFMNIQDGFNTKSGKWICTECKYENDVSNNNIF